MREPQSINLRQRYNNNTQNAEWTQQKRTQKAKASWTTSQKVALFGLGVVVVCGAAYLLYQTMSNGKISHFEGIDIKPLDRPILQFPDQFFRTISNGEMSSFDGRSLCHFAEEYPEPAVCDAVSLFLEDELKRQDLAQYKQIMKACALAGEGKIIGFPPEYDPGLGVSQITIGVNPKKVLNFNKALSFIEDVVLKNPRDFFSQNALKIEEVIRETHRKILNGLEPLKGTPAGTYRKMASFVTKAMTDKDKGNYLRLAMERGRQEFPEVYETLMKKFLSVFKTEDLILNEGEREFFQKYIGFVPPPPEKIPELMRSLASEIKSLANGILDRRVDAVDAAATVHSKMGDIHPFGDGNGRLARLWMNVMLQIGGYRAVIFPDDQAYTSAIMRQQSGEVGAFKKLLEEVILWNRRQNF